MAGVPPKKGSAFTFTVALTQQGNTKLFKSNPTLASGDVQVSKDYGTFSNIATLPDAEPDAGYAIRVQLSATEMDADVVTVLFHDAAGDEWCDQLITIHTDSATIGEIEAQTDDIGAAGAGLTAIPTIASVASVETVQAIAATGLAAIAAAVWDRLTSALTTAGSVGAYVLSKLGLITPANVTVQSPVASNLSVTTYQGDDYLAEDGRALLWTVASPATLMGGTASVVIDGVCACPATVLSETSIQCELTHAQTAAIPRNIYEYSLTVTQADGDVITLVVGRWNSKSKPVTGGMGVIV